MKPPVPAKTWRAAGWTYLVGAAPAGLLHVFLTGLAGLSRAEAVAQGAAMMGICAGLGLGALLVWWLAKEGRLQNVAEGAP